MVNGALLLNKNYTYKEIGKKILKLILLIIVWSIVRFPSWFLKTLIILYVIYPLLKRIFDKNKNFLYFLIGALILFPDIYNLIIVLAKMLILNGISLPNIANVSLSDLPRTGFFTMYSIPLFVLGGLQMKRKHKNPVWVNLLLILIGWCECLFESTIITRYTLVLHDSGNGNFPTIGAMLMAVGLFNIIYDIELGEKAKRIVRILSKNVLMVYILHLMVIRILNKTILSGIETLPLLLSLFISAGIYLICILLANILSMVPCTMVRELTKI